MKYIKLIFLAFITPLLVSADKGLSFPASPKISIADMRVVEGNTGQRSVEVMVVLSQSPTAPVTVAYSTQGGTAATNSDFVPANGRISFAPGETVKKITVSINGDLLAEASETFEIVLANPSGATIADGSGTVTIVNDDSLGQLAVYEVRLTFTGYTTFAGSAADCRIRTNGKVVMTGLLSGVEAVAASDDVSYTGTLQLDIDIDICSAAGEGDNARMCGITAIGSGPVFTELDIYYDARGGYIKAVNKSGGFLQIALGTCDQEQIDEEQTMIPNKTIASVFNGRDLPMLTSRTLRVGRYVETDDGFETVVEVLRVIKP